VQIKGVTRLLPVSKFMHIRRNANQVAHGLARLAMQARCGKVMHFQAPSEVQALVDRKSKEPSLLLKMVTPLLVNK
jgi:hypothetical protein